MKHLLIFTLFTLFVGSSTSDDWKLVKDKEDFKVYIRKPEGGNFEQIKIIALTSSPMNAIVAALEDVDKHKDWVYATGESYVIERRTQADFDYYVTVEMPFPVKNRDLTIKYSRTYDPSSGVVLIESTGISGLKDEVKNYVRIKEFYSTYTLTPQENGKIEIEYFLNANPGGSLPAWVVNLVTTKGPTETMRSLLDLLETGEYDNRVVSGL